MPGWRIVTADKASGRIEATDTTRWFGFEDDVVVRLTPWGSGTRVDVRSVSRIGRSDVGTNARRIRRYLRHSEKRVGKGLTYVFSFSSLRIRLVKVHRRRLPPDAQVDHLHEDREAHREVDVALRDVLVESFCRSATRRSAAESSAPASSPSGGDRRNRRSLPDETQHHAHGNDDRQHHDQHARSAMPTAVMTESSEKTMSSSRICTMTAPNDAATRALPWPSSPSSLS